MTILILPATWLLFAVWQSTLCLGVVLLLVRWGVKSPWRAHVLVCTGVFAARRAPSRSTPPAFAPGMITREGKPVPRAMGHFIPWDPANGVEGIGFADQEGTSSPNRRTSTPGADRTDLPIGEYRVTVVREEYEASPSPPGFPPHQDEASLSPPGSTPHQEDERNIHRRDADERTPPLAVTVEKGETGWDIEWTAK